MKTSNNHISIRRVVKRIIRGVFVLLLFIIPGAMEAESVFYGDACKFHLRKTLGGGAPSETELVKAELEKITLVYLKSKQILMEGAMTYFAKADDQKPLSVDRFLIKVKAGCMYSLIKHMERVSNLKYAVTVDKKDKTLIIDKGSDLRIKGDPRKIFKQQDVLNACKNISIKNIDHDSRVYHFEYEKSAFYSMDMQYNIQTKAIEKITMVYDHDGRPGNKIEISYDKTDFKTPLDDGVFSVGKYFTVDKSKKVNVQQAYKEYRIINHLN